MIPERKRFNYISRPPLLEHNERVIELEGTNRKILEQTTKQFKKLENDVQRVQCILTQKQSAIKVLKAENLTMSQETCTLREEIAIAKEEKNILIQALREKQNLIKQFESKLHQYINTREDTPKQFIHQGCNTEQQTKIEDRGNNILQEEVFQLREELYEVKNQLSLTEHQFETFKIIHAIDSAK